MPAKPRILMAQLTPEQAAKRRQQNREADARRRERERLQTQARYGEGFEDCGGWNYKDVADACNAWLAKRGLKTTFDNHLLFGQRTPLKK